MRRRRFVHLLFLIPLVLLIVVAGFGQAVLQLWNWLMPSLFGLPVLTFWQAVGLMALSWILFGGLRGFHGPARSYRRGRPRHWREMSPEQRAAFREALGRRCGPSPAEPAPGGVE